MSLSLGRKSPLLKEGDFEPLTGSQMSVTGRSDVHLGFSHFLRERGTSRVIKIDDKNNVKEAGVQVE